MKSALFPVLVTALLVFGGVWLVLNTNPLKMIPPGWANESTAAPFSSRDQAKSVEKQPLTNKDTTLKHPLRKKLGSATGFMMPSEIAPSIPIVIVPGEMVTPPVKKPFPGGSDIRIGMERSQIRERFGPPDLVATGADKGLLEIYVYHRSSDGKLTTVRLKDGVVDPLSR